MPMLVPITMYLPSMSSGVLREFDNSSSPSWPHLSRPINTGLNDCKFVSSDARDETRILHAVMQSVGHAFQKLIPDRVTERVIHLS